MYKCRGKRVSEGTQYCVHQASHRCHIYVSKSGGCFVRRGNETWKKYETLICRKLQPFDFILQKKKKKQKNWFRNKEVKKKRLWAFKDSDCMFGARVRKTAGARSCCIPELLAIKGLSCLWIVYSVLMCVGTCVLPKWNKNYLLLSNPPLFLLPPPPPPPPPGPLKLTFYYQDWEVSMTPGIPF